MIKLIIPSVSWEARFASPRGNDGIAIGTELQVNTYTTGDQAFTNVAAEPGGNFMVVWQSEGSAGSDSTGYGIQGQRFE
jgi:hypothetical protein